MIDRDESLDLDEDDWLMDEFDEERAGNKLEKKSKKIDPDEDIVTNGAS